MSQYNREVYNAIDTGQYSLMAPHLRHASIQRLYYDLLRKAFESVTPPQGRRPMVLDLGAGEGTVTVPLLEWGGDVTAVDISERQLEDLKAKCNKFSNQLTIRCEDINAVLAEGQLFDIVVANSLLHHIPDYVGLVRNIMTSLTPGGFFMCFQDPMWKESLRPRDALISKTAYAVWRLGQKDTIGGIARKIRRSFGFYSPNSIHDNMEYHAVRNGVDQNEIKSTLERGGFQCEIFEYCSFHSDALQPFGEKLGVRDTFGILAQSQSHHS